MKTLLVPSHARRIGEACNAALRHFDRAWLPSWFPSVAAAARIVAALALGAHGIFAQIPSFPGAEGFGAHATGGRGGDVYYVTNLNSSGAGSLRYGVENAPASGRTIVFAVSGHIPISNNSDTGNKTVRIVKNKITIAGQTAPGDGIGLKDGRILVTGDNTVLRNFRIRHGKNGGAGDCLNIDAAATDTMIDHLSLQFGTDEVISMYDSSPVDDLTLQSSIVAWGLESHSKGGLWSVQDATCVDSLWAHNTDRNPKAQPWGLLEWVNNVTLDYGVGFMMGDTSTPASFKANAIGDYFVHCRSGDSSAGLELARIDRNGAPNFTLWLDDCLHDSNIENTTSGTLNGTDKGYSIATGTAHNPANTYTEGQHVYAKATAPHPGSSGNVALTVDGPLVALKKVVSDAGAVRLDAAAGTIRDEVDALVMDDVLNQRRRQINTEANLPVSNSGFGTLNSSPAPTDGDLDGMPNDWETALGFNPAADDHNTVFASTAGTFFPPGTPLGYTYLEEYLHFLSVPHITVGKNTVEFPSSFTTDLRKFTSGFSSSPTFTIASVTGGTVQQFASNGTTPLANGPIAKFTPTQDFNGRAGFYFTVLDADGSSWTRQFAVLVKTVAAVPPPVRINVDFDKSGTSNPYSGRAAAADAGTSWNVISQPAASPFTKLNLTASNGTPTPYAVTISSSGGTFSAWNETTLGSPSPHGLMDDYLFGNTYTVTVSNLPAGTYQLYVYAHGDQANQASTVIINAANGGGSGTTGSTGDQYRNIYTAGAEGYSYLRFEPVVGASGTLVFTANAYLNGFQLVPTLKENYFVNATNDAGNTGVTQQIASMAGWGFSGAAPVAGETWNVFNETNYDSPFPNPLNVGQTWTIASNIALTTSDGLDKKATMTMAYHAATDAVTSDRLNTVVNTGEIQPNGVMKQLLRNYWDRNGSGNFQRITISSLKPNSPFLLYVYGGSQGGSSSWRARLDLDQNGSVDLETTNTASGALFTSAGGSNYTVTPKGGVWNVASVSSDATGKVVFDSRMHFNGFQIMAYQPPQITSQPADQTVDLGEQASFSVTAEANPEPSYQWYKNGAPISNATGSVYTIPSTTAGDEATYTVAVSNAGSSVTSNPATLGFTVDPYLTYVTGFELNPETDGAPGEDPDQDGLKNVLEFFLGMNPTATGEPERLPTAHRAAGGQAGIVFEFDRLKEAADIPFVVEYSFDLSSWSTAIDGTDNVTIESDPNGDYDHFTVTIPTDESRVFARLKL